MRSCGVASYILKCRSSFPSVACRSQAELWKLISCCGLSDELICQAKRTLCLLFSPLCPTSGARTIWAATAQFCLLSSRHRISIIVLAQPCLFTAFNFNWWWIMLHGVAYWLTASGLEGWIFSSNWCGMILCASCGTQSLAGLETAEIVIAIL